jgi:hypothetical protein
MGVNDQGQQWSSWAKLGILSSITQQAQRLCHGENFSPDPFLAGLKLFWKKELVQIMRLIPLKNEKKSAERNTNESLNK